MAEDSTFQTNIEDLSIAKPLDRVAAMVVDLSILGFLTSVSMIPIYRLWDHAQNVSREFQDFRLNLISFFLFVLLSLIYEVVLTVFWKATPGKKVFKIALTNLWEKRPVGALQVATRWLLFLFSAATVLPLLSVFTNRYRRGFHDLATETIMCAIDSRKSASSPHFKEILAAKGTQIALLSVWLFAILSNREKLFDIFEWVFRGSQVEMTSSGQVCPEIEKGKKSRSNSESLTNAISLYLAEIIDKKCLDFRAHNVLLSGESKDVAYLAKAFVNIDQREVVRDYLSQVCKQNKFSDACKISDLILIPRGVELHKKISNLHQELSNSQNVYAHLWLVHDFQHRQMFEESLGEIEHLRNVSHLSQFLTMRRLKALWSLGRIEEVRAAYQVAALNLVPRDRLRNSSWFCLQELEHFCGETRTFPKSENKSRETPKACEWVLETYKEDETFAGQDLWADLSLLKTLECRGERDLEESMLSKSGESIRMLALARDRGFENRNEELKILHDLFKAGPTQWLQIEILKRFVDLAQSSQELEVVEQGLDALEQKNAGQEGMGNHEIDLGWLFADFRQEDPIKINLKLLSKYLELDLHQKALNLGEKLMELKKLDGDQMKSLVVTAFRLKEFQRAWRIEKAVALSIEVQPHLNQDGNSGLIRGVARRPSSDIDENQELYAKVRKLLKKKFERS